MAKEKQEQKKNTNLTRIISGTIGFPFVAGIVIFGNSLIIDILVAIIALICTYEYIHCFKSTKKANPSTGILVILSALLAFSSFLPDVALKEIYIAIIPLSLLISITELVLSKGKKTIMDVAITMLGVCYIPLMLVFMSIIRNRFQHGAILIWYVFVAAWGSDIFAYFIGRKFGKHKYTEISPKKSIEGCVAGVLGAVALSVIFTIFINSIFNMSISLIMVSIITVILSIIGQIGDLAASSMKRHCGLKDFGELIPGHGGMLDRIDSVIFILPFAYILLGLLI